MGVSFHQAVRRFRGTGERDVRPVTGYLPRRLNRG